MLHIFKFILNDYIDDKDKKTLLRGRRIDDFDLPLNLLGISVHWHHDFALRCASVYDYVPVVEHLVRLGADIHILDDIPIRFAAYYGNISVVKFLVSKGANIHGENDKAL
jgi:ankyrin repeat protein